MHRRSVSPLAAPLFALAALAGAASAQQDRILSDPTGWWYLYAGTSADISNRISAGYRPFFLNRVGSGQDDTVFVANSGPYAVSGSQVVYGQTEAQVSSWVSANNLRLLDLDAYDAGGGQTRFNAVGIPNNTSWGWLYGQTFQGIVNWMNANPTQRLIDLDVYTVNGTQYYSGVSVANTGVNAQSWWYYSGVTPSQLSSALSTNHARLISLDVVSAGTTSNPTPTFACVMVGANTGAWWWYYDATSSNVTSLLNQNGARLTTLRRYTDPFGATRFAVVMADNSNDQTQRIRQLFLDALPNGSFGLYLKQVGGPVLANLNETFTFEPASTIKILHGTYAVRRCAQGLDALTNTLLNHDTCNPNECPDTNPAGCNPMVEALQVTLRRMFEVSDNNATNEIATRYGVANLNSFAGSIGLSSTHLNHTLGCLCQAGVENQLSLTDLGSLYEQGADGTLFNSTWADTLHTLLIDTHEQGYGSFGTLQSIIDQEAAATNLTGTEISQFKSALWVASKAGSYTCNGTTQANHRTEGGWARVPFKDAGGTIYNVEYVLGTFVNDCTDGTAAGVAYTAWTELLREEIRAALLTWDAACATPHINTNPANVTINAGQAAHFSVSVASNPAPLTYQWRRNNFIINNGPTGTGSTISGATTATLTISNASPADNAGYNVTVSTSCGSAISPSAMLTVNPICYANCDNSTAAPILNVNDFICFQSRFAAGDPYANCDGSTTPPVLNVNDFVCFQGHFAAGCP